MEVGFDLHRKTKEKHILDDPDPRAIRALRSRSRRVELESFTGVCAQHRIPIHAPLELLKSAGSDQTRSATQNQHEGKESQILGAGIREVHSLENGTLGQWFQPEAFSATKTEERPK